MELGLEMLISLHCLYIDFVLSQILLQLVLLDLEHLMVTLQLSVWFVDESFFVEHRVFQWVELSNLLLQLGEFLFERPLNLELDVISSLNFPIINEILANTVDKVQVLIDKYLGLSHLLLEFDPGFLVLEDSFWQLRAAGLQVLMKLTILLNFQF